MAEDEVREATLLKIALWTSIIGIIALLAILYFSDMEESSLWDAKHMDEDAAVKVKGVVERVSVKGNLTIITLKSEELLTVVAFDALEGLEEGRTLTVEGKVQDYNGAKEVVAERMRVE